jgi:hypothetical protein
MPLRRLFARADSGCKGPPAFGPRAFSPATGSCWRPATSLEPRAAWPMRNSVAADPESGTLRD